jgi:hypothetical protein
VVARAQRLTETNTYARKCELLQESILASHLGETWQVVGSCKILQVATLYSWGFAQKVYDMNGKVLREFRAPNARAQNDDFG